MPIGKLPATGFIELESDRNQWRLLVRGVINKIFLSGIVEQSPGKRVRIQMVLFSIEPPEKSVRKNEFNNIIAPEHVSEEVINAFKRLKTFMVDQMDETVWLMSGVITGEKPVPVMIMYIEMFDRAVYTTKFTYETLADFLPEGVTLPKN